MMLLTIVLVPTLALSVIGAPIINQEVEEAHAKQTAVASIEKRVATVPNTPTVWSVAKRANETGSIWSVDKRADEESDTPKIWSVDKRADEEPDSPKIWSVEKRAPWAAKLEQPKHANHPVPQQ